MRSHQRPFFRILAAGITLCTVLGTASCFGAFSEPNQPTAPDAPKEQTTPINVVASVNQWGALAEQIGGVHVKVTSILSSTTEDAHTFEPKTTAVDTLQKAQVVVSNGAGYDSWATKNLERDTVSVSAAQMVGAVEGDNPHLWFQRRTQRHGEGACRHLQPHHAQAKEIFHKQTQGVEQTRDGNREKHERVLRYA